MAVYVDIQSVRGAISIDQEPHESEMVVCMGRLLDQLLSQNSLSIDDIINIQFSQTSDLNMKNAATALREARPEFASIPLFCSQEPQISNMMNKVVRVLLTYRGQGAPIPVYLGRTIGLRPDCVS